MEHHRRFVGQFISSLENTKGMDHVLVSKLGVTFEQVDAWHSNPRRLRGLNFWRTAWLIHEQGYLCRELAMRQHLWNLFPGLAHEAPQLEQLLAALEIDQKKLLEIILRGRLSEKQNAAIDLFMKAATVRREDEYIADMIAGMLRKAGDLTLGLNGSAEAVKEILDRKHPRVASPLARMMQ